MRAVRPPMKPAGMRVSSLVIDVRLSLQVVWCDV
jgi:hypothetical protein